MYVNQNWLTTKIVGALCEVYPFQVSNQATGIHMAGKTTGNPSVGNRAGIEGITCIR